LEYLTIFWPKECEELKPYFAFGVLQVGGVLLKAGDVLLVDGVLWKVGGVLLKVGSMLLMDGVLWKVGGVLLMDIMLQKAGRVLLRQAVHC
jgi:hypothetical protein